MGRHSNEYKAFVRLTDRLLAVSHETIQARQAKYLAEAAKNPKRRGPKPKIKPSSSASRVPGADD